MDDCFGITPGAIAMATVLQILPQLLMVIDFTVKNDPDAFIFIAHRLVAGLDVNDAEAAHGQSDILLDKEAIVVRTAVDDPLVHHGERVAIYALPSLGMENSADSAHD